MSTTISDLEILTDMLGDQTIHDEEEEELETDKPKSYYHGKALHIRKQLSDETYFYFLEAFLKDFNNLNVSQKAQLKKIINIKPEIIIKEKVIMVNSNKKQNTKPKLNTFDDY